MKLKNLINKPVENFKIHRNLVCDDEAFLTYCPYGNFYRSYPMCRITVIDGVVNYVGNLDFDNDIAEDVIDPNYVEFCIKMAKDAIINQRYVAHSVKSYGPEGLKIYNAAKQRQVPMFVKQ